MNKKKKNYDGLCYFGLVFLIILLILPVFFRMIGKNWYQKEEKKKDIIEVLNCTKDKDSIYSTFLNGIPQYLEYKLNGAYSLNTVSEDTLDSVDTSKEKSNSIIENIHKYAKIIYSENDKITTFKVNISDMKQDEKYVGLFNDLNNQKNYFSSLTFYCTRTTY